MQLVVQEHTMTERVRTNPSLNSPLGFCCHEQQHHHLLDVLYTISIQGKEKSPMKPSISNLKVSFPCHFPEDIFSFVFRVGLWNTPDLQDVLHHT